MIITWNGEAEKTLRRVPFFVRYRVRRNVEEEVTAAGRTVVTRADLEESKKRHLKQLSADIKGYSLETCFGSNGCHNAVVASAQLTAGLETLLEKAELLAFLRSNLGQRLKLHHQFRVTVADCPNSCSQPQIKDIGIIGRAQVACQPELCIGCGECKAACEESAISLNDGVLLGIDAERCAQCGLCSRLCPTQALNTTAGTHRILVGGKLGRHPQLARELDRDLDAGQVLEHVAHVLDFYKGNAAGGERLGALIKRVGWEDFTRRVLE
jgi:anaerobic sulfite reductase subunit C